MAKNFHPVLRVLLLAVFALIVSVPYVHGHHWINHQLADFNNDHGHIFRTNLIARVMLVTMFGIVVHWAANVESLGGWILCAIGSAAVAYPAMLAWTIVTDVNPHVVSVKGHATIPYMLLSVGLSANMFMAVIYAFLAWWILGRRQPA
ncbi:MAG: hypothetical protein ACPG4M_04520 [Alphaproteobacteria bacterium]